jgi:apolipoprotein N-acyltransferase
VLLPPLMGHVALVGHVALMPWIHLCMGVAVVIFVIALVLLMLVMPALAKVLGACGPTVYKMEIAVLHLDAWRVMNHMLRKGSLGPEMLTPAIWHCFKSKSISVPSGSAL